MGDLTGKSLRDASLSLKNQGVRIRVTEAYSENVPVGCVITTEPAVGQAIFDSEYAVLQVSRGPKEYPATVPSLVGLTESHAVEMLIASGLKVGEIRYERSDASAGTVLWQSMPENSTVPKGSAISLKISAGGIYQVMEVPDLYGLTLSDAKRRLEEAGLVCGRVYTVSDGTKNGTVVAQSILPGTPITSALTAVDLYISS